jgi:hypothetical protein
MSWHTRFDSSGFRERIQALASQYLDGKQSQESAADQLATIIIEWQNAVSSDMLEVPPRFARLPEGVSIDLTDLRSGMTIEDGARLKALFDAAAARISRSADGAA